MNIFDLTGPEFLNWYFAAFGVAMVAAFLLPHLLRVPFDLPSHAGRDFSPFDIAGLKGGKKAAVNAVLATLWHRGLLGMNSKAGRFTRTAKAAPADLAPLEQEILRAVDPIAEPKVLEQIHLLEYDRLQSRLSHLGLMLSPFYREVLRLVRGLPLLLLLVVGIIKIGIGISRDRPVAFLVLASILTAGATVFWFVRVPRTSWRGDRVLRTLRHEHSALQFASRRVREQAAPADAAMSVALFGMPALAFGADLANVLEPPRQVPISSSGGGGSGGDGSSSSSSSCGGSSSSGGGGCGGCGGGGGGD
jgi:uncharacterized protein (TIGR04222 family)